MAGLRLWSRAKRPLFFLVLASVCFLVYLTARVWSSSSSALARRPSVTNANITEDCACVEDDIGVAYDFCYALPFNDSVRGRRFSCNWLPILKSLNLLDGGDDFVQLDSDNISGHDVVFVTAASQWYFESVLVMIDSIQRHFPRAPRVIFYDLGLNTSNAKLIQGLCNVDYRPFQFGKYPDWVGRMYEFRWKPLIIAEAMKEFKTIWYADTSVRMESGDLSAIYALFNCHNSKPNAMAAVHSRARRETCNKFPYLLHSATGHGIFSATDPDLYKFFPTDFERLKNRTCQMYEAGFAFIVRTWSVVRDVLKWYVLCALERDCMGPRGAVAACEFNAVDRYAKYAKCHRFDQSVLNLLLANLHGYDSYYWSSGLEDRYFDIVRDPRSSSEGHRKLKLCPT